jgi:aryl-alcohol dehydrogenase-like predicted oxidoreductase
MVDLTPLIPQGRQVIEGYGPGRFRVGAIPATTRVEHLRENMAAATGTLPGDALRRRMADYIGQL